MGTIERKGSDNLAESGATAVDQSNLGQAPKLAGIDEAWYGWSRECCLRKENRKELAYSSLGNYA